MAQVRCQPCAGGRAWHLLRRRRAQGGGQVSDIGFQDGDHARIGLARSRDGIGGWERHPANPIISPDPGQWDHDACYKPFAVFDNDRWYLWFNGRRDSVEQIGLATHAGEDLGF